MRAITKWFFPLAQFVILVGLVVNALYPETRLAGRVRAWLAWAFLGPQPEPPDMR